MSTQPERARPQRLSPGGDREGESGPQAQPGPLTAGERNALLERLYAQLHTLARAKMRGQRRDHTLQATALLNEALLKLLQLDTDQWHDEGSLMRLAGAAMRSVLIDHARSKNADKRNPGGERQPLDDLLDSFGMTAGKMDALGEALELLREQDPRAVEVIEQRFFLGFANEQAAKNLGISPRTADRDWKVGRAFLASRLSER